MATVMRSDLSPHLLREIPPLQAYAGDLLQAAGSKIRCGVYQRGDRVYGEMEEPNNVFALHHGRIRTLRITPQGKDVTLYLVEPGQLFGVDGIANGGMAYPWGHDAEALASDTVVVSLPRKEFGQVAARQPGLMSHVMRSLWSQAQDLMDQAETRAFHDVRGRVAHALLVLAYKEGVATRRGVVISPGMTHEELAALAGTRRESVTMALSAWRRQDLLGSEDGERSLVILDIERLAEYREGGTSTLYMVDAILDRLRAVQSQDRESRLTAVEQVRERKRATYHAYTRR